MSIEVYYSQNLGYTPMVGTIISRDQDSLCGLYSGAPYGYITSIIKLVTTNHDIFAAIEVDGNYHIDIFDVNNMMAQGIGPTNAVSKYGTVRFPIQGLSISVNSCIYADSYGKLTDVANGNPCVGMVASFSSYDIDLIWFGDWCGNSTPIKQLINNQASPAFSPAFNVGSGTVVIGAPAIIPPPPPFPSGQAYVAHLKDLATKTADANGKYNPPAQCKKCNYINEYLPASDYICRRCITMYNLNS